MVGRSLKSAKSFKSCAIFSVFHVFQTGSLKSGKIDIFGHISMVSHPIGMMLGFLNSALNKLSYGVSLMQLAFMVGEKYTLLWRRVVQVGQKLGYFCPYLHNHVTDLDDLALFVISVTRAFIWCMICISTAFPYTRTQYTWHYFKRLLSHFCLYLNNHMIDFDYPALFVLSASWASAWCIVCISMARTYTRTHNTGTILCGC